MNAKIVYSLSFIFVVLTLFTSNMSCSQSMPTIADAREEIDKNLDSSYNGGLKILNLKKTDGQLFQQGGVQYYKLEFKGTAEAVKTMYESFPGTWIVFEARFSAAHSIPCVGRTWTDDRPDPEIWIGRKYSIEGIAGFEKKESGWVPVGAGQFHVAPYDNSPPDMRQIGLTIIRQILDQSVNGVLLTNVKTKRVTLEKFNHYVVEFEATIKPSTKDLKFNQGRLEKIACAVCSCSELKETPTVLPDKVYSLDGNVEFTLGQDRLWHPGSIYNMELKELPAT